MTSERTVTGKRTPLPNRVAEPMRQLVASGHLSPEELDQVMVLCALRGEPSRAMAFAIVVKFLNAEKVPVSDTLGMAEQLDRKINPAWSAERWREEHNRMARMVTVRSFAQDNRRYEIDRFTARLPERWPGYVIPSRRRLAMEGLRQRHCIASYDSRLLKSGGRLAVATVFAEGQRWTVLLGLDGTGDRIVLHGAKGCRNARPSAQVRDTIATHLQLSEPHEHDRVVEGAGDARMNAVTNFHAVMDRLREIGVCSVGTRFDGGGDSGDIEMPWVSFSAAESEVDAGERLDGQKIALLVEEREYDPMLERLTLQWVRRTLDLSDGLHRVIESRVLEEDVNWCDGRGGSGTCSANLVDNTFSIRIDVNAEISECVIDRDEPFPDL